MKFKAKVIGIGDSIGLTIPKKKANTENLEIGDYVDVDLKKL